MPARRRVRALVPVAVLSLGGLVALGACGGADDPATTPAAPATSGTSTPEPGPTAASTGTTPTTDPTSAGTPTGDPAEDCPATGDRAIPDGAWTGPISLDVRGRGGQAGFADSRGTGTMSVVVADGSITSGTWRVSWRSIGHADTGQATATIDLDGTISGTVRGTAARPVLPGTWALHGTATITSPVQASAPVDETGTDTSTLKIRSTTCDQVTGTFVPSFNSKNAAASFTGTARWVGSPRG